MRGDPRGSRRVTKPDHYWIFVYLFAKKDRENIDQDELAAFKKLSKDYAATPPTSWKAMLENGDLKEICNDEEADEAQQRASAKGRIRRDS